MPSEKRAHIPTLCEYPQARKKPCKSNRIAYTSAFIHTYTWTYTYTYTFTFTYALNTQSHTVFPPKKARTQDQSSNEQKRMFTFPKPQVCRRASERRRSRLRLFSLDRQYRDFDCGESIPLHHRGGVVVLEMVSFSN